MEKLTIISRFELEIISNFLQKFKEWTKHVESEKTPTLWMVWPIFVNLQKHLVTQSDDPELIQLMKKAGRDYIQGNMSDIEPQMMHKIGTTLHPLLKNIAMASTEDRKMVYDAIDDIIRKHESKASENVQCMVTPGANPNEDVLTDLNASVPLMDPFEFDLLGWWFANRYTFPNLFRLFLSRAGITASSAPSERRFSETEIIITARRASLLPDTVSDMVLARNRFLKFP